MTSWPDGWPALRPVEILPLELGVTDVDTSTVDPTQQAHFQTFSVHLNREGVDRYGFGARLTAYAPGKQLLAASCLLVDYDPAYQEHLGALLDAHERWITPLLWSVCTTQLTPLAASLGLGDVIPAAPPFDQLG